MRRGAEEESPDSDGDVDRPMPRRSDSRIATDFNDYDVLIIRGECSEQGWTKQGDCYVVKLDTCKRSRSIEAVNFM